MMQLGLDTNPPMKPSGVRIGTPAVTTRGMKEPEMRQISHWIAEALDHRTDAAVLGKIRKQVLALAEEFPLYAERRGRAEGGARTEQRFGNPLWISLSAPPPPSLNSGR